MSGDARGIDPDEDDERGEPRWEGPEDAAEPDRKSVV